MRKFLNNNLITNIYTIVAYELIYFEKLVGMK